jgi:hypothetical protein
MTVKQMEAVAMPEVHCNGDGLLSTSAGSELQIPVMQWLMWRREWLGRVSGEREECWCGGFETEGAPFIAARGGRRAELGSSTASSFQGGEEARHGRKGLATSRRC